MTNKQLELLATEVMGWHKCRTFETDGWARGNVVQIDQEKWCPHIDFPCFFWLLDTYNKKHPNKGLDITYDSNEQCWWLAWRGDEKKDRELALTHSLGSTGCQVILKRIYEEM